MWEEVRKGEQGGRGNEERAGKLSYSSLRRLTAT